MNPTDHAPVRRCLLRRAARYRQRAALLCERLDGTATLLALGWTRAARDLERRAERTPETK